MDVVNELEKMGDFLINYLVIPLFAFANAGIDLSQMSVGSLVSGVGMAAMVVITARWGVWHIISGLALACLWRARGRKEESLL